MTLQDLKAHCERTLAMCDKFSEYDNTSRKDSNTYQEHKMVLDLIEEHERSVYEMTRFIENIDVSIRMSIEETKDGKDIDEAFEWLDTLEQIKERTNE